MRQARHQIEVVRDKIAHLEEDRLQILVTRTDRLVLLHATLIEDLIEAVRLVGKLLYVLTVEQTEKDKVVAVDLLSTLALHFVLECVR